MSNKNRQKILSVFKMLTVCCTGLILAVAVALGWLAISTFKSAKNQPDEIQQTTEQIVAAATASSELIDSIITNRQAVINGARYYNDDVSEGELLSVCWLEDNSLQQADPASSPIIVSDGQRYNFSLAVTVADQTAQGVRALVCMPEYIQPGETASVEVLVMADNAVPYYESIELTVSAEPAEEDKTASTLSLSYRDGSAVLHSNGLVDGTSLDTDKLFGNGNGNGVLLGNSLMNGIIPAGDEGTCIISWTIDTTAADDAAKANESQVNTLWDKYQQCLEASKP